MPTFWINLSQGMPAALLCKTPLLCTGNTTEIVNKYRPLKHQPSCSAGTLHVTQCGNTSSKARVSGSILLEKTQNKNPASKQTVHFKPLFLLLSIFNSTFLEYYFKNPGEILPSPGKTQYNFKITVWQTAALREQPSSKWLSRRPQSLLYTS